MMRGSIIGFLVGVGIALMLVGGVEVLPNLLWMPAFVMAALFSGNVHNPGLMTFAAALIVQWTFVGWLVGAIARLYRRFVKSRESVNNDV